MYKRQRATRRKKKLTRSFGPGYQSISESNVSQPKDAGPKATVSLYLYLVDTYVFRYSTSAARPQKPAV